LTNLNDYQSYSQNDLSKYPPHYRRPGTLAGYTGFIPHNGAEDVHELDIPTEKYMICGYTGFVPSITYQTHYNLQSFSQ